MSITARLWQALETIRAYTANEEPRNLKGTVQMETKTYTYDPKVSAIHKLRVNVKSLAAEAKIIRQEERRAGYQYQVQLQSHRRGRLREEARYAQLALAYVRGRKLRQVEGVLSKNLDTVRLAAKLSRVLPQVERKPDGGFGPTIAFADVYKWATAE